MLEILAWQQQTMHKPVPEDNWGVGCRQLYCSKACKLWVFTVHFLLPSKTKCFTFQTHLVLINCCNQLPTIQSHILGGWLTRYQVFNLHVPQVTSSHWHFFLPRLQSAVHKWSQQWKTCIRGLISLVIMVRINIIRRDMQCHNHSESCSNHEISCKLSL